MLNIQFYKKFYDDVKHLNQTQTILHFKNIGMYENRIISFDHFFQLYPYYDHISYKFFNSDILIDNKIELMKHWHNIGQYENRLCSDNHFKLLYPNIDFNNSIVYKNDFHKKSINVLKYYDILCFVLCNIESINFIFNLKINISIIIFFNNDLNIIIPKHIQLFKIDNISINNIKRDIFRKYYDKKILFCNNLNILLNNNKVEDEDSYICNFKFFINEYKLDINKKIIGVIVDNLNKNNIISLFSYNFFKLNICLFTYENKNNNLYLFNSLDYVIVSNIEYLQYCDYIIDNNNNDIFDINFFEDKFIITEYDKFYVKNNELYKILSNDIDINIQKTIYMSYQHIELFKLEYNYNIYKKTIYSNNIYLLFIVDFIDNTFIENINKFEYKIIIFVKNKNKTNDYNFHKNITIINNINLINFIDIIYYICDLLNKNDYLLLINDINDISHININYDDYYQFDKKYLYFKINYLFKFNIEQMILNIEDLGKCFDSQNFSITNYNFNYNNQYLYIDNIISLYTYNKIDYNEILDNILYDFDINNINMINNICFVMNNTDINLYLDENTFFIEFGNKNTLKNKYKNYIYFKTNNIFYKNNKGLAYNIFLLLMEKKNIKLDKITFENKYEYNIFELKNIGYFDPEIIYNNNDDCHNMIKNKMDDKYLNKFENYKKTYLSFLIYRFNIDNNIFIDIKTIIINLDERIDRFNNIVFNLENLEINNYIRFSALKLDDNLIKQNNIINIKKAWKKNDIEYIRNAGGCKLSHRTVLEENKNIDEKYLLILEDDCFLEKNIITYLYLALNDLEFIDWDILYFTINLKNKDDAFKVTKHLLKINVGFTTTAMLINKKNINKIISIIDKSDIEIDNTYNNILLNRYCIYPMCAYQYESYSDINKKNLNYGKFNRIFHY